MHNLVPFLGRRLHLGVASETMLPRVETQSGAGQVVQGLTTIGKLLWNILLPARGQSQIDKQVGGLDIENVLGRIARMLPTTIKQGAPPGANHQRRGVAARARVVVLHGVVAPGFPNLPQTIVVVILLLVIIIVIDQVIMGKLLLLKGKAAVFIIILGGLAIRSQDAALLRRPSQQGRRSIGNDILSACALGRIRIGHEDELV
mmetsp:Transcript_27558/g.64580  ORF Transcript_27558/g.64580 Transcript_27558/m.64580 type:complete len:203 (+) Transcript_27558:944-1552(+)